MSAIDLFAGPGGWDLAALNMGLDVLGIEFDDAACATRRAAGLNTLQADVSALDPINLPCTGNCRTMPHDMGVRHTRDCPCFFNSEQEDGEPFGLIASPPCQAFSMAGKGEGRKAIDTLIKLIEGYNGVWHEGELEELAAVCGDERAHLVLEPLRWAHALDPDWIAFEQVEPVRPIWQAMAIKLQEWGYSTWTGVLSAEQYGVPQTRRRAFLIARKSELGIVKEPPPTHQRYIAPQIKRHDKQEVSLFDAAEVEVGERQRVVHPHERDLLPWVSMAEALGWGMNERPSLTLAPGAKEGSGPSTAGGSGARAILHGERDAGRWVVQTDNFTGTGYDGVNTQKYQRPVEEPAPTLTGGVSNWQLRADAPTHLNNRDQKDGKTGKPNRQREVTEPAPTIAGESRNDSWVDGRPATTVAGDARVFPPSRLDRDPNYQTGDGPVSQANGGNAVRVTQQEAAILQSFPANYPWQGSKTKQFQQIGNAVPPLLALAVLGAVIPQSIAGEVAA